MKVHLTVLFYSKSSSLWLKHPVEEYARQIGSFQQVGLKIYNSWNRHLFMFWSGSWDFFPTKTITLFWYIYIYPKLCMFMNSPQNSATNLRALFVPKEFHDFHVVKTGNTLDLPPTNQDTRMPPTRMPYEKMSMSSWWWLESWVGLVDRSDTFTSSSSSHTP